jgi:bile acid:Na+ symporter, BASS family
VSSSKISFNTLGYFIVLAAIALLVFSIVVGNWQLQIVSVFLLAVAANLMSVTKEYAFGLWVLAFVIAAMIHPALFIQIGRFKGSDLVAPLIQFAMFGMGATLTISDFARVLKMPKAIAVGIALQYTVMPLTGYSVAKALQLPNEVAAGVLLVGCCPGGVSSNVITYLAKGNVALSVTLTACTTLMAPVMTPLTMYLLAGALIEVPFLAMMISILWIVIVPVVAGLVANIALNGMGYRGKWMDRCLSLISMIAICLICAIIAANSRDKMASVGPLLLVAVVLHNTLGYLFGYWGSYAVGLDESARRTVAIEVGLQNGGMAAQLATDVLKSSGAALAPVIFAPWMNLSGSMLAAWWKRTAIQANEQSDNGSPLDAATTKE